MSKNFLDFDGLKLTLSEVAKHVPEKTSQLTNDSGFQTASDVRGIIAEVVDGAPEEFDTLKEIADYLKSNDNVVAAINAAIAGKASKEEVAAAITEAVEGIDLSSYLKSADLVAITAQEIAAAAADAWSKS